MVSCKYVIYGDGNVSFVWYSGLGGVYLPFGKDRS